MLNYEELAKETRERDLMLKQMICEMKEESKRYREESKIYYQKIEKQLEEIKSLTKYTLTEQEKQRYASMSMSELLIEMQKNIDIMMSTVDKVLDKDNKKAKVEWGAYAELV